MANWGIAGTLGREEPFTSASIEDLMMQKRRESWFRKLDP